MSESKHQRDYRRKLEKETTQPPADGPRMTANIGKAALIRLPSGKALPVKSKEAQLWLKS